MSGGDGSSLQEQMGMEACGDVFSEILVCTTLLSLPSAPGYGSVPPPHITL